MGTIFLVSNYMFLSAIFKKIALTTGLNCTRLRTRVVTYIPPPLTVHFSMTRSLRYQPIITHLINTLHNEHAYCFSYHFLNNVVITTFIEMVEMVEILDGRLGKSSVERVRYVINNLLHLVIVKYGVILLCISSPSARDNTVAKSYWGASEASETLFTHVYGISSYSVSEAKLTNR